jgi:hypothetical protein
LDDFGSLVYSRKLIKRRVLQPAFWFDIASCVPLELLALAMGYGAATSQFQFARLNRGLRCLSLYTSPMLSRRHYIAKLARIILCMVLTGMRHTHARDWADTHALCCSRT